MDIKFKHRYIQSDAKELVIPTDLTSGGLVKLANPDIIKKSSILVVKGITPKNLSNVLDRMCEIERTYYGTFSKYQISIYTSLSKNKFEKQLYKFLEQYLERNCIIDDGRITRPETLYRIKISARQDEGKITFIHGPSSRAIIFKMILLFGLILENADKFLYKKYESSFVQYLVDNNLPYLATMFYLRRNTNISKDLINLSRDVHYHSSLSIKNTINKKGYLPALKLIRDDYNADVPIIRDVPLSEIAKS